MSKTLERVGQVAGSTLLSRVLGLIRDLLAVRVFGASELHSAFLTAFTLPNLFRRLLGEGALTGAMVPVLAEEFGAGGKPAAFRLMNEVFTWLTVVSGAIVLVLVAGLAVAPRLPGFEPRWLAVVEFSQLLLPYLVFACGAAIQAAALNVLGHFAVPALSQVLLNLAMIVALNGFGLWLADTPEGRMAWLCGGVLAGGLLQVLAPAVVLWKLGWRPEVALRWSPRLREIVLLLLPGLAGVAIYQVNLAASRFFAFDLNESATTLLFLASRLMELPIGLFSVAVSTVVFPLMAQALVRRDAALYRETFLEGARLTLAITVPAAVGLALLGEPIVRVLFQRGSFTAAETAALVPVLVVFAAALPFYALVQQCARAFHAARDMRTPVRAALASFVINVALCLLLPPLLGTLGLAVATNVAVVVQCFWLVAVLGRAHPGLTVRPLGGDFVKIAGASAAMGLLVLGGGWLCRQVPVQWLADAATLGGVIPLAAAAYAALLWVLRIRGRERVAEVVRRRLGGR